MNLFILYTHAYACKLIHIPTHYSKYTYVMHNCEILCYTYVPASLNIWSLWVSVILILSYDKSAMNNTFLYTYIHTYRISRNIDSDFNLAIWRMHRDRQINLHHYGSIYTTSMGFSPYSTEIRQFKILPTVLFEQTAKYNVHQYFCLYGIYIHTYYTYI